MFWAVVIVSVGLIVLFTERPNAPDARGEPRLAGVSRQVRSSSESVVELQRRNPLVHLTASSDLDE